MVNSDISKRKIRLHNILEEDRHPLVIQFEDVFVRFRSYFILVHLTMFLLFGALMLAPLYLSEPSQQDTFLTDFTLLSNYLIWGLWFPLVFLSVIFSGRSWCGLLCPLGAASEWANKIGPRLPIPAWIRWEGTPIVSFLLITIWGQTIGVRDHKEAIAIVFGSMFVAAFIIGYFFGNNKRTWCRHICPIGLLLGVFSRLGAVQFTPKVKKTGGDLYSEKGMCPTMIDLKRKEESRHCIECFRCVHPEAKGGLRLDLRIPGREIIDIQNHNPNISEVWFLFLGTGSALGGFLWLVLPQYQTLRQAIGNWFIENEFYWIGLSGPVWLMSYYPHRREMFTWLDFYLIIGFMLMCMLALSAVLFTTTKIAATLSGKLGSAKSARTRFIELGYQYAPIAMISLVVGLGGDLFSSLTVFGFSDEFISYFKLSLFIISFVWSILLGERILQRQGIPATYRIIPLAPGIAGSLLVSLAWWPAIF